MSKMDKKEFEAALKYIYGDKKLDSKVMRQMQHLRRTNPELLRSYAKQKRNEAANPPGMSTPIPQTQRFSVAAPVKADKIESKVPSPSELMENRFKAGDFSGLSDFGTAFNEARKRGLKEFTWKETKANPSARFTTQLKPKKKETEKEKESETEELDVPIEPVPIDKSKLNTTELERSLYQVHPDYVSIEQAQKKAQAEALQRLKEKSDELMPGAIPADELVRHWLREGYLPNTQALEDQLYEQIQEIIAPSKKSQRDAAWNFAKAHGNFPGTFYKGRYIPNGSDNYFDFPPFKYNYNGNDYLLNEYRKLYGSNLSPEEIEGLINSSLMSDREAFEERVRKNQEKIQSKKQGGTMNKIKYFAPGGTVSKGQSNGQADAFMQAVLQGNSEAIGQLIEAAKQGDKNADKLIQTILQEDKKGNQQVTKAASVIKQLLNQTVSAKWGSKLDYVKSLKYSKGGKHSCPACEQKVEMKKCGGKKAKKHFFGGDFDVNEKNPMRMSNGKNVVGIINRERFKNSSNRGLSQTIYDSTGRPVVQKDKTSDGGEREIYYNVPKPIKRKGLFGPRHEMVNDTVYISGTPEMFENAPNMSTIEKRHQAYNFAQGVE